MVGFRGAPTRLDIRLEKPLFFFSTLLSFVSSLYLWRELMPFGDVSPSMPASPSICDKRTAGLAASELWFPVV